MRRNTVLQTASGKARARSVMQSFRLSHDERAELRALARAARVSVSDYLRGVVSVHVKRARKAEP